MAMATLHVPRAIALAMMALLAGACSPPMGEGDHELTLPEKVQSSDLVIFGEVKRTYPDPRFDYGSGVSSVYTAEMTVFCVIRGRRTKAVINVTEAGSVPGLCTSTELVEGQRYIVMLRRDRSRLTPAYAELPATQANLIAATSDCSLRIQYPRGTNSRNAQMLCPTDNTHLSCDEGKEHGDEREPTAPPPPRRETAATTPTTTPRPTPSPTTTTAPPPKVNICDDEEATNVISEDDCGPRVNKVLGSNGERTITSSLLLCFVVLMATVVIEC